MKKLLFVLAIGAAVTGVVIAGPSTPNIRTQEDLEAYVDALFERYDADGSGSISRDEVTAHYAEAVAE